MYLSRLALALRDRKVQRALQDPYRLHQGLLTAFPADAPGGGDRVLFRVEPEQDDGVARVLVQSALAPDWDRDSVSEQLPLVRVDGPKELSLALRNGLECRFRLRANPTRRKNEKRLPVLGEAEQLAWLRRKLERAGMEVIGARGHDEGMLHGTRRSGEEVTRMTFVSVLYDGVLRVRDPEGTAAAVTGGIGSGKAFGFGLLSLARG